MDNIGDVWHRKTFDWFCRRDAARTRQYCPRLVHGSWPRQFAAFPQAFHYKHRRGLTGEAGPSQCRPEARTHRPSKKMKLSVAVNSPLKTRSIAAEMDLSSGRGETTEHIRYGSVTEERTARLELKDTQPRDSAPKRRRQRRCSSVTDPLLDMCLVAPSWRPFRRERRHSSFLTGWLT